MIEERNCMIIHGPKTLRAWLRNKNEETSAYLRNLGTRLDAIDKAVKDEKAKEAEGQL
jgi:hypothetical protein